MIEQGEWQAIKVGPDGDESLVPIQWCREEVSIRYASGSNGSRHVEWPEGYARESFCFGYTAGAHCEYWRSEAPPYRYAAMVSLDGQWLDLYVCDTQRQLAALIREFLPLISFEASDDLTKKAIDWLEKQLE